MSRASCTETNIDWFLFRLPQQTNVYPSAQRRKMRPFEGFQRKAIVIVPTDEEFKSRCEKREKEEGKEIPDSAVMEMKGRTDAGKDFTCYFVDVCCNVVVPVTLLFLSHAYDGSNA